MPALTKDQERICAAAIRLLAARLIFNSLRGIGVISRGEIALAVKTVLDVDDEVVAQAP